jgi:hypothetical protein
MAATRSVVAVGGAEKMTTVVEMGDDPWILIGGDEDGSSCRCPGSPDLHRIDPAS